MTNMQSIINLVWKAIAVAMSVAAIVLGILGTVDVNTQVMLLGIGLFALSIVALQNKEQKETS